MNIFKQKLIWFVALFPLAGCAPLTPTVGIESKQTTSSVHSELLQNASGKNEQSNDAKRKAISEDMSNPKKLIPVENTIPPNKKGNVNPDPNVSLIAPPTALPKTVYSVPQVEEHENFVPPAVHTKKICKKHKKCVTVKVKTPVNGKAVEKSKHNGKAVKGSSKKGAKPVKNSHEKVDNSKNKKHTHKK